MTIRVVTCGQIEDEIVKDVRDTLSAQKIPAELSVFDVEFGNGISQRHKEFARLAEDPFIMLADVLLIRLPSLGRDNNAFNVANDIKRRKFRKNQAILSTFAARMVSNHGSWGYLGTIVVGDPDHNLIERVLQGSSVTKRLGNDASAKEIADAIKFVASTNWWSTEHRGALPTIVVHRRSGFIIRANETATRLFGQGSLLGRLYMQVAELTNASTARDARIPDNHPISRSLKQNAPLVQDRILSRKRISNGGEELESFNANVFCHPVPIPETNKPQSAVLWIFDQSGQEAVMRAVRELSNAPTEDNLNKLIVELASRLGFNRARLYKYDKTKYALFGKAQVGYDDVQAGRFLTDGGIELSVLESSDSFDPTSKIIVDSSENNEQLSPFLVTTKAEHGTANWELRGQECITKNSAKFARQLDKESVNRWIEAPICVPQDDNDERRYTLWGKLSLERGVPSDDLTIHDLQLVGVFATVVGEKIVAWERQKAERKVQEITSRYSEPIEQALAGNAEPLLKCSARTREYFDRFHINNPTSAIATFDLIVASIESQFLELANAEIAVYREYEDSGIGTMCPQRLGPVLFCKQDLAERLTVPNDLYNLDAPEELFPIPRNTSTPVQRVASLRENIEKYLSRSKHMHNEKQLAYFEFIQDELQVVVRQGTVPKGVICLISGDPNAFRLIPRIIEQLQPIASVWIDLASRQASRQWLVNASSGVTRLLPILDSAEISNDTAWYAGLAALLSAREGLQWNRVFIFDCNASYLPDSARIVYALGGLADDDSILNHVDLQREVGAKYEGRLESLLRDRISTPSPHVEIVSKDGERRFIYDRLYKHLEDTNWSWTLTVPSAGESSESMGSIDNIGDSIARLMTKNDKYVKLRLSGDLFRKVSEIHESLAKRDEDLYVFGMASRSSPRDDVMGWILLSMHHAGDHRTEDMIEATWLFLTAASELLAVRRLKLYWQGWNRNAPTLFHDARSVREYIPKMKEWVEEYKCSPPPPNIQARTWTYITRSVELLGSLYDKPPESKCNLNTVMSELQCEFSGIGTRAKIRIVYDSGGPDLLVPCDQSTLRRVIKELLSNSNSAFQRSSNSGPVIATIEASNSQAVLRTFDGNTKTVSFLEIHYRDSGPGLNKDECNLIFLDGVSGSDQGGRGKGLTLQRARLMAYGGDLRVEESVSGEGAHFIIVFNIEEPM